ncbi:DUF1801 domain-containing protein [Tessaracoccus caeni]|uniref:DUF1801 domain-containing protein n=1 Tax=Tessaracoccus caeni TaxID=3031239 RepID=UPI0023DB9553|nr:DUF1801 domain-containing protein [Tessaracoccus caeni]MDF1489672.1 DUF1801 domain-containing protein [Tessaracoccus caeni]
MAKTHPHIDTPTAKQLATLVEGRPEPLVEVYLALHELVVSTLPDVRYSVDEVDASVGYAAHQFGYNGWGMAALTPFGKWVSFTLLQGSRLADPSGLLVGTAAMRHVKLKKPEEVRENEAAIRALIRAAAELYSGNPG